MEIIIAIIVLATINALILTLWAGMAIGEWMNTESDPVLMTLPEVPDFLRD